MQNNGNFFADKNFDYNYHYAVGEQYSKSLHEHTFYEFFLTLSNGAIHFVNGKQQVMHDDMLVLIRPGDAHYFEYRKNLEPRHINLAFRIEIIDEIFAYLGGYGEALRKRLLGDPLPPICILSESERQRIIMGMNQFNVPDKENRQELRLTLRFFVIEVLSLFEKQMSPTVKSGVPEWLERACIQMREHENFVEGLHRMVEISGKTREHLARSIRKYKNITATEFINNLRLEYAANKLVSGKEKIIDICYESGFTTLDYFGKQFKQKYGMAPTVFRNLLKKDT